MCKGGYNGRGLSRYLLPPLAEGLPHADGDRVSASSICMCGGITAAEGACSAWEL